MEVGEGEATLAVAEPVEMDATDSFIAEEEFNPNMSLVDLAPTPSVIVQHMPDGVRDDYQVSGIELICRMESDVSFVFSGSADSTSSRLAFDGIRAHR